MNHETPEWARDAISENPKVIAIDAGRFDEPAAPEPALSHGEVREAAIARSKQVNASMYSLGYKPDHWQSFVGEESSRWDFDVLASIGRVIREPRFRLLWAESLDSHDGIPKEGRLMRLHGGYSASQGCWIALDGSRIPLAEFREAVTIRVAELRLSYDALYNWAVAANPTGMDDLRLFDSLPFEEKMKRFKVKEK